MHLWIDYAIDAHAGTVFQLFNKVRRIVGSGIGTRGDTKSLEGAADGGKFTRFDTSRTPNGIATYNAKNKGIEIPAVGLRAHPWRDGAGIGVSTPTPA